MTDNNNMTDPRRKEIKFEEEEVIGGVNFSLPANVEIEKKNRKNKKLKQTVDAVCIGVIEMALLVVTLLNLFQGNRPTESVSEKRKLAEMPAFSFESLLSGEYLSKVSLFFSDTFWQREKLVDLSKKMDLLRGLDYKVNGQSFIIISGDENDDDDDDDTTTAGSTTEVPITTEAPITNPVDTEEKPDKPATNPPVTNPPVTNPPVTNPPVTNPPVTNPPVTEQPKTGQQGQEGDVKVADAEFFSNGLFIYGDAVYMQAGFKESSITSFMEMAKKYENAFGYPVKVSVLAIPTSSMIFEGTALESAIKNQTGIYNKMQSLADPSINVINAHAVMSQHKNEYMYFKTDHHWTNLGAYYAYTALAKSMGFTPTPLSSFEHVILNDNYHGSYYGYTKDERVKSFHDEIHAYIPTKANTMSIGTGNSKNNYDCCIIRKRTSYLAFIGGDNAFTEITVPENPQSKAILVFKDSFGDAFVPYLCEHFGKIYVVDPRYFKGSLKAQMSDKPISDILFLDSLTMVNSGTWLKMYNGLLP